MQALAFALALCLSPAPAPTPAGEEPVAPHEQSDANAGATPIAGAEAFAAFNGHEGVARVVDSLVDRALADPELGPILEPFDMVRLRRTLKEQICYLLGGGCAYTGRDMTSAHADLGITTREFNLLVGHLRAAMREEGVPNWAQNRLLGRLAPMRDEVVTR